MKTQRSISRLLSGCRVWIFAISLLIPLSAHGQSDDVISLPSFHGGEAASCMSFTQAQKLSVARDPAIGEVEAQKQDARAGVKLAKSDWLPQISTYARTATGSTGLVDGRTDNQIGVLATQRIFDFGHGKYGKQAAQERLKSAEYHVDRAVGDSLFETSRAFLTVLEAQERLQAARMREAHFADIVKTLPRRLYVNLITAAQASSIEGDYALAQSNRIEEDLNLANVKSNLYILTGEYDLPCTDTKDVLALLDNSLPKTMTNAISEARRLNPEVEALQADVRAAEAEYQIEKRRKLPIVEVQGAVAYILEPSTDASLFAPAQDGGFERSERIGLDVSVPLWSGGRFNAGRSSSQARKFGMEMTLERVKRDLESRVSLAWHRIASGDYLIQSRRKVRNSLEDESRAINREFENGLRPYQDVEEIEAELQSAILQEINAKYEVYYQRILLLSLTDRLQLTTGERLP